MRQQEIKRNFFFDHIIQIDKVLIVLMGIIMLASCLIGGIEQSETMYVINETCDSLSICFLGIMLFSFSYNMEKKERITYSQIEFHLMLLINAIAVFLDFFAWRVQGIPQYRVWNFWINTGFYLVGPFTIFMFWMYIRDTIRFDKEEILAVLTRIQKGLTILAIGAILLNIFLQFYFTVDIDGVYHRTESFLYNMLLNAIMVVITLIVIIRSKEQKRDKLIYIAYTMVPFISAIIQSVLFGISLTYAITALMMFWVYSRILLQKDMELVEMKMKIMHSQMQPHFIANGMASLRSLIKRSPETAEEMVNYFVDYLRESMRFYDEKELIPIEQEIDFVISYLEIEKIRFSEKIKYIIEENNEPFQIPPITIQPLVENAIRHGIRRRKDGSGHVWIKLYSTEKEHVIQVIDDGVGFDCDETMTKKGHHIGIQNTKNRLHYTVGGRLVIKSEIGQGTTAEIYIPKRYKTKR